ncbi:hypothetical protein BJY04DRAFT_155348 [Aspergillus karnatakaensis]|uniref:uncharacterized protein n=1 Tax=Aspergillus karnatakaensis TaxID=1810916 RepID=UPI003CCDFECC
MDVLFISSLSSVVIRWFTLSGTLPSYISDWPALFLDKACCALLLISRGIADVSWLLFKAPYDHYFMHCGPIGLVQLACLLINPGGNGSDSRKPALRMGSIFRPGNNRALY